MSSTVQENLHLIDLMDAKMKLETNSTEAESKSIKKIGNPSNSSLSTR